MGLIAFQTFKNCKHVEGLIPPKFLIIDVILHQVLVGGLSQPDKNVSSLFALNL